MTDEDDGEDAQRILSRRQLLVASALSGATLAAAGASAQPGPCLAPPPQPRFSRAPGRRATPRDRVPAVIREWLVDGTLYAAGGGLTSVPWRVVLSLEGTLRAGVGDRPGGASHAALATLWATRLMELELQRILEIADRAWREARPPTRRPTADYDEVLAMRDGDDHFFAQGFGPLRGGAAEELVRALRRAADAARP